MKRDATLPLPQGEFVLQAEKDQTFRRRLGLSLIFLFCVYVLPTLRSIPPQPMDWLAMLNHGMSEPKFYAWPHVPSQQHLDYQPCYRDVGRFECARLSVPLDHFNGTTTEEISLAIIRLPALIQPDHPQYGGAILFNPGGPGGSGVGFLLRAFRSLEAAIHGSQDDDPKLYDFISFDPRGVALSEPRIKCFSSNLLSWTWALRELQEGILGSSDATFGRLWSMWAAMGGSCSQSAKHDSQDIKRFVSTASVAADMVKIVEAHGFWREKYLESVHEEKGLSYEGAREYDPSQEKLNYWGFSYGTYLGMTFASMFPDRISRLIVDGVVDAVDYTKGLWYDNLADTEDEMNSFYEYCASAGFPACAIANKTGKTTAAGVKERTTKVLEGLYHNPLPIISENPEIISYSDVRNLIFAGLYKPLLSFPIMADVFAELEQGNGTQMAGIMAPFHEPTCFVSDHEKQRRKLKGDLAEEASVAISCSDGDSQSHLNKADFKSHLTNITRLSPTIGPMWAAYRMRCTHYTVRAEHRYPGPWQGNTSYPLLFIGNSADPVTPVRNARKLAKGYKDAKVLEVGGSGHCSISTPSACARKVIYRYIQYGELPEDNSFCKVDELPFTGTPVAALDAKEMLSEYLDIGGMLMPMV